MWGEGTTCRVPAAELSGIPSSPVPRSIMLSSAFVLSEGSFAAGGNFGRLKNINRPRQSWTPGTVYRFIPVLPWYVNAVIWSSKVIICLSTFVGKQSSVLVKRLISRPIVFTCAYYEAKAANGKWLLFYATANPCGESQVKLPIKCCFVFVSEKLFLPPKYCWWLFFT